MDKKLKIAVGMSGGVDSGVSAKLLVDAGYDVSGVHLHFWAEHDPTLSRENKCCSTESLMAARRTCDMLGIPFYTFNFEDIFKETVVDYFVNEFKELRTPNPCIVCNRKIKTGRLVKYVQGLGFDLLATGHYIRVVEKDEEGSYSTLKYHDMARRQKVLEQFPEQKPLYLMTGMDQRKDQSYFLYTMKQEDLVRLVFPLGEMVKDEVRAMAKQFNLPVAQSKESFDICFIPGDNYRDFLMRHMPEWCVPGEVVDTQGNSVGTHTGLPFYSIGQRRGFTSNKPIPYYVVGFKKDLNQLVVGNGEDCNRKAFSLHSETFASDVTSFPMKCSVRLRHMGSLNDAILDQRDGAVHVTLEQPQRSISPGQSAVFYDGSTLLGGGVIDDVLI